MSRILKRPMFRKGGEVMEGIMTGIKPRTNYSDGSLDKRVNEYKDIMRAAQGASGGPDGLSQFLIRGGMNLVSGANEGDNVLQTLAGAYQKPTEQLFASLDKKAQQEKQIGLQSAMLGIKGEQGMEIARAKARADNRLQKDYSSQRVYDKFVEERTNAKGKLKSFEKPTVDLAYPRGTALYDAYVVRQLRTTDNENGKKIAANNMGFVPFDSKTGTFDYNAMQAGAFYFDPKNKVFIERVPASEKDEGGFYTYDLTTFTRKKLGS